MIIYDSKAYELKRKKNKLLEIFASSLITFSIVSLIFYFFPIVKEEIKYINIDPKETRVGFGDIILTTTAYEAREKGIDPYFSISIPRIGASSNIIPNIDPANEKDYLDALKKGVAHAKGTNFPGQGKLIYLFSHSTNSSINISRYNAIFYLLRKLEKNDKIYVYFLNKKYIYEVLETKIVDSTDTSWLIDKSGEEVLVLQTCDPPGTSLNRLIVVAKPSTY